VLAVRRAPVTCTLACLALAVAGCAAPSGSSVTVSGSSLTIYASAPAHSGNQVLTQDVLAAEQLALQQNGTQMGRFTIKLVPLTSKPSDNARTAIQDSTAIAYLGEPDPQASSSQSLGITNSQDLLQVTPTDTALELTQATPVVAGSPGVYYESQKTYGRTFARVVPSTALEAKAQIEEMQAAGVKRLYVSDDGTPYGKAVAYAVRQDAPSAMTVVSSPSGADGTFYGASSDAAADRALASIAGSSPSAKLFVPSAVADDAFASGLPAGAAHNTYVSAPGFLPRSLSSAGRTFVTQFNAAYHRQPAPQAIFGYEAMSALLAVLREAAGSASNRSTVVRDFFSIKNRDSALGTYSINPNGDTSLGPFVFSRIQGGKLVPFRFVQVQG
jgi:branched-chain amino acid transport system substrate-binding protein